MSKKQHIIERTIYPEVVELLKSLEFSDVLGESKVGQNRSYTDITFSYEGVNFLAEIKFGDITEDFIKPKIFGQTYRYAKEKGIENFIILVYPNELQGHIYIDSEWFTNECTTKPIRCFAFMEQWIDNIKSSPKDIFHTLKRICNQEQLQKPSLNFIVKQLQSIVQDLNKVNNYANKTKLVEEVVDKLRVFIGISGLEDDEKIKDEIVNLSTYLLFNQLLFYRIYRIKVKNNDLKPLEHIKNLKELQNHFDSLEIKGYSAIFSSRILNHLSDNQEVIDIINDVIESLQYLRPEIITHDIAGMFFHKLIPFEIRKVLATFYTVPNAADLLAGLTIKKYNDSVFDPACGSGTLLVASYKTKQKLYSKNFGDFYLDNMHKKFLENDITGFDIMPFAAHLSAMNLTLQDIEQNTDTVRIGSGDSLDLASQFISESFSKGTGIKISKFETHTQNPITHYMEKIPNLDSPKISQKTAGAISIDGKGEPFNIKKQDIVIMNPPFSDIEKIAKTSPEMLEKLKNNLILSNIVGNQVNLWAYFLVLAELALKENGRISAIIPISFGVGGATQKIRMHVLKRFTVCFIIKPSNQDKAFSQNAALKDILFIADKKIPVATDKTAIVILKSSIKNATDDKIENIINQLKLTYSNYQIGYQNENDDYLINIISAKEIADNASNLMPFFVLPQIKEFVNKIRKAGKNILRKIKTEDMHEGYHLSPAGTSNLICITNPFHPSRVKQGAFLILEEKKENSLVFKIKDTNLKYEIPLSKTTNFLRTLTGVKKFVIDSVDYAITSEPLKFDEIVRLSKWSEKKHGKFNWTNHNIKLQKSEEFVYIPCVFRPDSKNTHNFAFFSPNRFHTSHAFKALRCKNQDEGIYQTLLMNSSFGIALLLMYRSQATGGKTNIHEHAFYNFDIFEVSKLTEAQKSNLKDIFNKIKDVEFPSLKEQFEINYKYRRMLDITILEIFGIDVESGNRLLDKLYKILPDEFTVD